MRRIFRANMLFVCMLSTAILGGPAHAGETVKLTLEQAIAQAMKTNYSVLVARERLSKLEATIGEARSGAFPQLAGSASYTRNVKKPDMFINETRVQIGYNNVVMAGLDFTQPLYAAGKVGKALKAAKSETMSAEAQLKDVREEIELQVKKTFYQVLLADRTIEITKKTLEQLEHQLSMINARYDKGLESDYTLMRQEVQVSNIQPELSAAEKAKIILMNAFRDLLGFPKDMDVSLDGALAYAGRDIPPKEKLVEIALSKRQDIAAADAHLKSLKYFVGIEKGGYLPTLNFVSSLDWQAQSDDFTIEKKERAYAVAVGLQVSWPIFDGLKTHYRVREANSELKIATTQDLQLKANVASDVINTRATYDEAVKRESSQKKALGLAQKAVDIATVRFREGLMSQLELNDTILQRDQSDKLYAQAVYDCLEAEANIVRVVGGSL